MESSCSTCSPKPPLIDSGISSISAIRDLLALPLNLTLLALSGALNTPSFRLFALVVGAVTLAAPWFASSDAPAVRGLCAAGTVLCLFRNLDIYRGARRWSVGQRVIHLVVLVDTRKVKAARQRFVGAEWVRAALFGAAVVLGTLSIVSVGVPSSVRGYALRWLVASAWVYTSIEFIAAFGTACARVFGAELPRLHADPIFSATLSEFWGKRWNLIVHQILHEHCFRPLAMRFGLAAAAFGTFVLSGLLHFWLVLASTGFWMATSMGSFFFVQGALVLLEARFGVRRWPRPLRHLWTVSLILLPAPLLLEPLLRAGFGF